MWPKFTVNYLQQQLLYVLPQIVNFQINDLIFSGIKVGQFNSFRDFFQIFQSITFKDIGTLWQIAQLRKMFNFFFNLLANFWRYLVDIFRAVSTLQIETFIICTVLQCDAPFFRRLRSKSFLSRSFRVNKTLLKNVVYLLLYNLFTIILFINQKNYLVNYTPHIAT